MSNTIIIFSSLCIILLLLQPSYGVDPLYHICSGFSSPPTSQYKHNLNTLLTTLTTTAPPTGFSRGSIPPKPNSTATAYGLALCRGDVSSIDCKSCLTNATTELLKLCPDNKAGGIIWYDNCLLKYSDDDFFGQIDTQNKFTLINVTPIGNNPDLFKKKVKDLLMNQLVKKAVISSSGMKKLMYAASEVKLDTFTNLYGMVQCTRDLSMNECEKCLDEIVGEFPDCCDAKQGGRVVTGSCNFRYEIYPFLTSSS